MFYFESFFFIKITTLELFTALEAEENVFARKLKTSNAVLNRIEYNFLHFPSIRLLAILKQDYSNQGKAMNVPNAF